MLILTQHKFPEIWQVLNLTVVINEPGPLPVVRREIGRARIVLSLTLGWPGTVYRGDTMSNTVSRGDTMTQPQNVEGGASHGVRVKGTAEASNAAIRAWRAGLRMATSTRVWLDGRGFDLGADGSGRRRGV